MLKDREGRPLKRGLYIETGQIGLAVYFTGEYTVSGEAIMERESGDAGPTTDYPEEYASRLKSIAFTSSYLPRHFQEQESLLKSNQKLLARKFSQLEKATEQVVVSEREENGENLNGSNGSEYLEDDIPF